MADVICVLGMHRSGTSVAARLLNVLGVDLGVAENLIPAAADNPKGFWEHRDIVAINDEILDRLGGNLVALPPFPDDWEHAPELADLRTRARAILHENSAGRWAFKDPRTCLTLAFWQQIIPDMKYLFCLRDPADVASSLVRRNGMPHERGVYLWLRYTQNALRQTVNQPRCFVCYDRLIDEFASESRKVAAFLEHSEDPPALSDVIDRELRHHQSGADASSEAPPSPALELAQQAYRVIIGETFEEADVQRLLANALGAIDRTAVAHPSAQRLARRKIKRGTGPLVSVVVNNYNYWRFLGEAIDSALEQTYAPVEVIVVDDGSTDESRAVIEGYDAGVVHPVFKTNGGQASAFNEGFAQSSGQIIIFLDADDTLMPRAVERAVAAFADANVVKVHWPLWEMDADRHRTGRRVPSEELADGDLRAVTLARGPSSSVSAPTSGNAWARSFLENALPMPESAHRISADAYLFGLAPAFGVIKAITQPQGLYRVHGANNYRGTDFEQRLKGGLVTVEQQWRVLAAHAQAAGMIVDVNEWRRASYFHQLRDAIDELTALVPSNETLILADEGRWGVGEQIAGRRTLPFLEDQGWYNGRPQDDATAIAELERMRAAESPGYLVFAWPAFWWLDYYKAFTEFVRSSYASILANELLIVFDLRRPPA